MKLEMFVFDVFPYMTRFTLLEGACGRVFAVEEHNAEMSRHGHDRDLLAPHRRFLEAAGATVREDIEIELSPFVTYSGEWWCKSGTRCCPRGRVARPSWCRAPRLARRRSQCIRPH
ncbi:hypothetical protein BGW80DRAFT_1372337 [Lactifluus volemus]|nr:hypothetical protein BGW80DRAFT_1372337 [Lactifluus volemus]